MSGRRVLHSGRPIAGSHSGESRSSECACVVYHSRSACRVVRVVCVCVWCGLCVCMYACVVLSTVRCRLCTRLERYRNTTFHEKDGTCARERDLRDHPAGAGGAALSRPTPGVPVLLLCDGDGTGGATRTDTAYPGRQQTSSAYQRRAATSLLGCEVACSRRLSGPICMLCVAQRLICAPGHGDDSTHVSITSIQSSEGCLRLVRTQVELKRLQVHTTTTIEALT